MLKTHGRPPVDQVVARTAAYAFFHFGGSPVMTETRRPADGMDGSLRPSSALTRATGLTASSPCGSRAHRNRVVRHWPARDGARGAVLAQAQRRVPGRCAVAARGVEALDHHPVVPSHVTVEGLLDLSRSHTHAYPLASFFLIMCTRSTPAPPMAPRPTLGDLLTETAELLRRLLDFLDRSGVFAAAAGAATAATPNRSARNATTSAADLLKQQQDLEARRVRMASRGGEGVGVGELGRMGGGGAGAGWQHIARAG